MEIPRIHQFAHWLYWHYVTKFGQNISKLASHSLYLSLVWYFLFETELSQKNWTQSAKFQQPGEASDLVLHWEEQLCAPGKAKATTEGTLLPNLGVLWLGLDFRTCDFL